MVYLVLTYWKIKIKCTQRKQTSKKSGRYYKTHYKSFQNWAAIEMPSQSYDNASPIYKIGDSQRRRWPKETCWFWAKTLDSYLGSSKSDLCVDFFLLTDLTFTFIDTIKLRFPVRIHMTDDCGTSPSYWWDIKNMSVKFCLNK